MGAIYDFVCNIVPYRNKYISNDKVKIGQHCWAIMDGWSNGKGELLVVCLKESDAGYEVCGPWECGANANDLKIVSIINKPRKHKGKGLYYSKQHYG